MTAFDRRSFLLGSGAILVAGGAHAHPHPPPGRWTPLSAMLFPARDISAAPFYSKQVGDPDPDKPKPFNVIVTAGGDTPNALYNITDRVTYYDPVANRWSYATPLPEPLRQVSLAAHNGFLFAVGGYTSDESSRWIMSEKCWRIPTLNGEWEPVQALPHPIAEAVCLSFDRMLHVVGGRAPYGSRNSERDDHIETDQHWAYDAGEDEWVRLEPMPTSRSGAAGAALRGALHVVGGRSDDSGDLATHEVYDPLADRWGSAAPLPEARSGLAAATLGGQLYAFGGARKANTDAVFANVWSYDPREDTWSTAAPMIRPRHGFGAALLDGAVYIVGGAETADGGVAVAALDRFNI